MFTIGGLAQIFWVLPVIRQWGRGWYIGGVCGTLTFITIWVITRIPNNPITGRDGGISPVAITVEVFQIAFLILSIIILANDRKRRNFGKALNRG